jgi:hypothetical protein
MSEATTIQVLIEVTNDDGTVTPEVVDLDLDLSNPSLQESVIWEEEFGEDSMRRLLSGDMKLDSPKKLRVFLYARLKTRHPELAIDGFDLDYDSLSSVFS